MSPIHDQGYRHYGGQREAHGRAWFVIAKMHVLAAVRYKPFLVLLLAASIRFIVYAVQVYIATVPAQSFITMSPQLFENFLSGAGNLLVFLVTISQAGLIADDRRANALQLYLSKPLTRVEYITGKLVPPMLWVLAITWVPAMLLLVLHILLTGSVTFLRQNLFLIPAITLVSFLRALLSSFLILALSSMTKSRRFVSVMYAGVIFFSAALYQALRAITTSRAWAAISPGDMMDTITTWVFRSRTDLPVPISVALAVVIGLMIVSALILERRVRAVEVVA